jgi:hypothetical protein
MGTQVVETGAPAFQVPPLSILPAKSTQEGFTQVPTPIITCQAYETRKVGRDESILCRCKKCRIKIIFKDLSLYCTASVVQAEGAETFISPKAVTKFPSACDERATRKIIMFVHLNEPEGKSGSPSS